MRNGSMLSHAGNLRIGRARFLRVLAATVGASAALVACGSTDSASGVAGSPASVSAPASSSTPAPTPVQASPATAPPPSTSGSSLALFRETRYADVLGDYEAKGYRPATAAPLVIPAESFVAKGGTGIDVATNVAGRAGPVLVWGDGDNWVEWEVDVPDSGLYSIQVEYYPLPGKEASIQRDLQIDGAYPFGEAKRLVFDRVWVEKEPPHQDNHGNDVRAPQVEQPAWQTKYVEDADGMYREPFAFYLTKGQHRIRMATIREPAAVSTLTVAAPRSLPTYAEVAERNRQKGVPPAPPGTRLEFQAEDAWLKSDPTIRREICGDPGCRPFPGGRLLLNMFGGYRWRQGGQWATWRFSVPQDGLYLITGRLWQGFQNQLPVVREVTIDGQIPFRELEEVLIPFYRDWQFFTIGPDANHAYQFYLTKGEHVLGMRVKSGPVADTVRAIDRLTLDLSDLTRQIRLITGPNPDPWLQYDLARRVPPLQPELARMAAVLQEHAGRLIQLRNGERPSVANALVIYADQLRGMHDDPDSIPRRLDELNETQSALGTWRLSLQEQPVQIDYFVVGSPDLRFGDAAATTLDKLLFSTTSFAASFGRNYSAVGSTYGPTEGNVIEVWVGRGLEWGQIMKDMVEDDFTPSSGIKVNLHTIPPGQLSTGGLSVLLLALTSGEAPDVATGVSATLPVEFAIRRAILNLSGFADYASAIARFRPGSLIPYQYQGGNYAFPETQNFTMLFTRTDVLGQLGLKVPETWSELYDDLWILQQNGLDFYYPPPFLPPLGSGAAALAPFLYQNGGSFFTPDAFYSALNSAAGLKAFRQWTDLYSNYRIQVQADFFNRMRTGEMPIGIADYWTYVLLSTAAPELTGRWQMSPLLGTARPDGAIDRSSGGAGDTSVIFRQARRPGAAWEFLKWWTSERAQIRYGTELEALLGVEARWNTANVDALKGLPWPKADIAAILQQWEWFREQPIVLGGYFSERHVTNAWNRVVLQGWNPREALEEAVKNIDRELAKKQEEFGITPPARSAEKIP